MPATATRVSVTHRSILGIAVPMTLGFLTVPFVGIVAMAVIGQSGIAAETAGVALGAIMIDLILSTCNFLRSGTTGMTAQAVGRGGGPELSAILQRAMLLAVAVGGVIILAIPVIRILAPLAMQPSPDAVRPMLTFMTIRLIGAPLVLINMAIFGWVLGQGRARLGLVLISILNGANIALSIGLASMLGWGVAGVAIAEIIAEIIALAAALWLVRASFRPDPAALMADVRSVTPFRAMLTVNRDLMLRSLLLLAAFAFFARQGARQGDVILSANAILEKFFLVGGYFLDGLATATETFAGQSIGAQDRASFTRAIRLTAGWGIVMAALLTATIWCFGPYFIALMTTSADIRAQAGQYLVWSAITPVVAFPAFLFDGVYIGSTWSRDMRNMMLASFALFIATWALAMPIWGNHGLWAAFLVFLAARGLTLGLVLPRRVRDSFSRPSWPSAH